MASSNGPQEESRVLSSSLNSGENSSKLATQVISVSLSEKASPWRPIREDVEGDGGSSSSGRAKKLFVVQASSPSFSSPIKEKVEAVVSLLDQVALSPTRGGGCSFASKEHGYGQLGGIKAVGSTVYGVGRDTGKAIVEDNDTQVASYNGPVESRAKKWKRFRRGGVEPQCVSSTKPELLGGNKRHNDAELLLYTSDFDDDTLRKRIAPMDIEDNSVNENVAGSTERALGEI
ncbi:unnamed protein product [Amaranthus hypochondriacus]